MFAAHVAALRRAGGDSVRWSSTIQAAQDVLRFCVVGSGPAGFYTVDKLLKRFGDEARIDLVEALPTPFGLVRSGVAPDHTDTKNVTHHFSAVMRDPRVTFLGNVRVGAPALPLPDLRAHYNAVVLAYGAESDRRLGIPGDRLPAVFTAREFVWWYNGHPACAALPVDLRSVRSVAICGLGNVAVDCARVLLKPAAQLAGTDMAAHAVRALQGSAVREVHLVGRRGPAQAAFTPKELRELLGLEGVQVRVSPEGMLDLGPACQAEVAGSRIKRRVVEVLGKALKEGKPGDRTLHIHFLRSPTEVLSKEGAVAGLRLERTALVPPSPASTGGSAQRAVGTGEHETLAAELVLQSIGYRSVPLEGAAFDHALGVVPNEMGQALAPGGGGGPDPGLFVSGWLKRGPTGIIGTNLVDAEQTVDTMVRRRATFPRIAAGRAGGEGLRALLRERGVEVLTQEGWEAVDAAEVDRGRAVGKPREKLTTVEEMLAAAAGAG